MNKMNIASGKVKKFLLVLGVSLIMSGIITTGIYFFDMIKIGDENGEFLIDGSNISVEGEIVTENNMYSVTETGGTLTIDFHQPVYIYKLQYQYNVSESIEEECNISLYTKSIYGADTVQNISDNYFSVAPRSVLNIKREVQKIVFNFSDTDIPMELQNFYIDNNVVWNPFVFAYVCCLVFFCLFMVVFRKDNAKHPEVAVFIGILCVSGCMLVLQPAHCSGWDEQIHFRNSYNLAYTGDKEGAPYAINFLEANAHWLNMHHEQSAEERADIIRIVNSLGESYGDSILPYNKGLEVVGYLLQAIAITIGKALGLPFYLTWLLGKFMNLLMYAVGMSIAVAIVPVGKRLLALMSLFPTMIFSSTIYTYDVTVTVLIIIGLCIWIKEAVEETEKFEFKWRVAFLSCIFLGCMPKAVYAPLILCVIFLPSAKFYSKKDEYVFKGIVIMIFVGLMSTFVLPTLLAPPMEGDSRGGNTSVALQLKLVLTQPFAYAKILWQSITRDLWQYVAGNGLSSFAYWQYGKTPLVSTIIMMVGVLMDNCDNKVKSFSIRNRIISAIVIVLTVVLIWTALYLSYTEVGSSEIVGVQARYYFPFLFLLYMCCKPEKLRNDYKVENYQLCTMGVAGVFTLIQIGRVFLLTSCL